MMTIGGTLGGNLTGTLYFLYFQLMGFLLAQFILNKKNMVTRILCGSVLGSVLLSWCPAIFSFFFDFSATSHICAAVCCGIAVIILYLTRLPHADFTIPSFDKIKEFVRKHCILLLMLGITFIVFCIMLSTHTLSVGEDGIHTGQSTYGDMNMHLGFITSIAKQQTFPPYYSILPETKLSWPFLCDSISSSIYIWGASLRWAYMLPMYFAILQVMAGFYCIAYSWLKKASHAALAWFLFFYNGGLGFVYFIDWTSNDVYTLKDIFTQFYQTPTNLTDNNIRWVNIIVDMLLPQRATLFGYAILFTCIWLLWRCVFNKEHDLFPITAILTASLPMIHTHSFLAMGMISVAWLLVFLLREINFKSFINYPAKASIKYPGRILLAAFLIFMCGLQILIKNTTIIGSAQLFIICITVLLFIACIILCCLILHIKQYGIKKLAFTWGIYLCIILLLALPQLLYWTFEQASGSSFNIGLFNWGNLGDNYLWFYIKNWGIILLLLIPAICYSSYRNLGILSAGFLIWFVVELIAFSPNPYDNNKLLYVAYIFLCCISAKYGCDIYNRLKLIKGTRLWCALFLLLSGISAILSIGRELVSDCTLYSNSHLEAAAYVDGNTPVDSTFLTNDRHINEIASLTGRNIVSGAPSFLAPHGVYDEVRVSDVKIMFENPAESKYLFQKYSVDYVMISSWERSSYAVDEAAFDSMFKCVFSCNNDEIKIYKVE